MTEYLKAMINPVTFSAAFRLGTPLLIGLSGYCFSNKVGILNIALESFMMISAFFSLLGSYLFLNQYIGALFGILSGIVLSIIYGILVFHLGANGLITGVGFNLSGWGLTTMLLVAIFKTRGAANVDASYFASIDIPFLRNIPFISDVFNNQTILVYISPMLILISYFVMYKTPFGLRARGIGLNSKAAETAGIRVIRYQWVSMIVSGATMGLSGAFISLNTIALFSENMTSGRGFLVLASAMVGKGNPIISMLVAYVFSYFEALTFTWSSFPINTQLIQMLPYVAVLIVLFVTNFKNIKNAGDIDQ
ncbi:MAG: ABC transporter permease [Ruminococcaceae bacterium]|nr:ABC transporter permease [Oscillospiraceae bacterium]